MTILTYPQTSYSKVRNSKGAHYDYEIIHAILDQGMVAHMGFIAEGRPMVIPMAFARLGGTIYLHGAKAARSMKAPGKTDDGMMPACLTVTMLDGIVVARSAFHHSVNYRSAVVHGNLRPVDDDKEKETALIAITNHLLPDRWDEVRPMTEKEFKATGVLALEIETASAKIRQGPPSDDEADYERPYWAGILPVSQAIGLPVDDGRLADGTNLPSSLTKARKKFA